MNLIKRLIAFARLDSYLCRRRQARALEVLELVFPSKPLVAKHLVHPGNLPMRPAVSWRGKR